MMLIPERVCRGIVHKLYRSLHNKGIMCLQRVKHDDKIVAQNTYKLSQPSVCNMIWHN